MKKKVLITINSLEIGGIQKSLISFLNVIDEYAEIDVLITDKTKNELSLPNFVNKLNIGTLYSLRKSLKYFGVFSKEVFLSVISLFFKKRWKAIPKLKKKYDVAISYSNVGYGKYYVIDKVKADRKYLFYHNGAYEETGKIKVFDEEYYLKFSSVIAVAEHVAEMLREKISKNLKTEVIHNLISIEEILQKAEETCEIKKETNETVILTVGRISQEKRILIIPEVCKALAQKRFKFKWYIVGDGPQAEELKNKIRELEIENICIPCGAKNNPYSYMKNCDIYAQLSEYEAEPITIQEVALFNKPMVLSSILGFKRYYDIFDNINLTEVIAEKIAEAIISLENKKTDNYNIVKSLNSVEIKNIFNLITGGENDKTIR